MVQEVRVLWQHKETSKGITEGPQQEGNKKEGRLVQKREKNSTYRVLKNHSLKAFWVKFQTPQRDKRCCQLFPLNSVHGSVVRI